MGLGPAIAKRRDVSPATLRAVVAVLALYAVLLQAFLGGLMAMPAAADGYCVQHAAGDPNPGGPVLPGHGDCCTAVQALGTTFPPRAAPLPIIWRAGLERGHPLLAAVPAPAPPGRIAEPRGPPTV